MLFFFWLPPVIYTMFPGKQDVDLGLANDGLNQTLFIYVYARKELLS